MKNSFSLKKSVQIEYKQKAKFWQFLSQNLHFKRKMRNYGEKRETMLVLGLGCLLFLLYIKAEFDYRFFKNEIELKKINEIELSLAISAFICCLRVCIMYDYEWEIKLKVSSQMHMWIMYIV